MKKYLVFAGSHHYPEGGVMDLIGDFDEIDGWKDHPALEEFTYGWLQVVLYETMKEVASYNSGVSYYGYEDSKPVWEEVKL